MSFRVTTNSSQASPRFCQSAMSQIRFRIWQDKQLHQRSLWHMMTQLPRVATEISRESQKLPRRQLRKLTDNKSIDCKIAAKCIDNKKSQTKQSIWKLQMAFEGITSGLPAKKVSLNACGLPQNSVVPSSKMQQTC